MREKDSSQEDEKPQSDKAARGIHSLRETDMQDIMQLLKAGERSSAEIRDKITRQGQRMSSSVFKNRIDELMKRGQVESYEDSTDRRRTLYRIKSQEKVEASRGVYLAARFLESLKDPSYLEKPTEEKGYRITMSAFFEGEEEKAKLEDMAKSALEKEGALHTIGGLILKLSKVNKFAVVYAVERTGRQPKE